MPVSTGTTITTTRKLNREELAEAVDIVQRSDTPIYSMIGGDTADSTNPNWGTEDYDAPGENIQSEGRDYNFAATPPALRYSNHTQTLEKNGKFSGSQEAVRNAGGAEQRAKDKIRKGVALRTDVEWSIVSIKASLGGTDRQSGSLATWATTNVSRGAGGVNGGYVDATKVTTVPTAGTKRAWTKTLTDDLLQAGYTSGAKLEHLFCSPYNKRVFATFMSDPSVAQFRYDAKTGDKNTIVADAEIYMGPLGTVYVHPNHVMAGVVGEAAKIANASNVFVLDTSRIKWAWLRRIAEDKELAKTGDYSKFILQGEGTLKPMHEKAIGVIADTFGTNATT